ncbi:hypothetical protein [Micromonospora sp. WMMB235]|uniref:hypothetical protein n=1 Tax=Micromonospora sp. WMMB235 TaxID=1172030 RepID=UPI001C4095EB|nr:hypothetical protein [Micromonospora sp. WMMB235]
MSKLVIDSFRGFRSFELRCPGHVVLSGVPRAGRSDVISALARVLLPESSRTSSTMSDLWQTTVTAAATGVEPGTEDESSDGQPSAAAQRLSLVEPQPYANVEVTLTDLDPELEQLFEGFLERCGPDGCAVPEDQALPGAPWCVRLAYRLMYDRDVEALEQFVYYPLASNPTAGKYTRVPASTRRALPVVMLNAGRPLQLRAGSPLRRVIDELDPAAAAGAFDVLRARVTDAAEELAGHDAVAQAVGVALASGGVGACLAGTPVDTAQVGFRADDGTAEAMLRSLQPTLNLDAAGPLTLASHGSTAGAMLAVAEAIMLATAPGAVILADDFGDQLDTANAEHLAARLRASAGQLWLSTRRPEVARAFDPEELVRLTRHGGDRAWHRLKRPSDRGGIRAMRQLHTQLLPALTSPTVAITEGPHDLVVYGTVDRQRLPAAAPLSAAGVRLVAAGTGQDGGIGEIPVVADLARSLGFRVIAMIDRDKAEEQTIKQLEASCDVVVRLPPKTAIEGALLAGADIVKVRAASATLTAFLSQDPADGVPDAKVVDALKRSLHKKSLHEPFLDALVEETKTPPPMIVDVLNHVAAAASSSYSGPAVIDIPPIPSSATGPS